MARANVAILLYPYFVAACFFASNYVSGTISNHSINSAIETDISEVKLENNNASFITYSNINDTNYIITGIPQRITDSSTATIIRLLPRMDVQVPGSYIYPQVKKKSIQVFTGSDKLNPIDSTTSIFSWEDKCSLAEFFILRKGQDYRGNMGFSEQDRIKQSIEVIRNDTVNIYLKPDLRGLIKICDRSQKPIDFYEPLKGFIVFDQNYWFGMRSNYYDKSDKSYYTLVHPAYYNPDPQKVAELNHYIYLARFNVHTQVYKALFNWKMIDNDSLVACFKNQNKFWILTKKRAYVMNLPSTGVAEQKP
ncbi:MAG TPA: hypothetical protein VK766_09925 [Cytophagaceae bacterium]|nr:hypothetical protein [Cytophagaceae bacterium]